MTTTGRLRATAMDAPSPGGRSPKSGCQQGRALCGLWGSRSYLPLPAPGGHLCLPLTSQGCVCLSPCPLFTRTPVIVLEHAHQGGLMLTDFILRDPVSTQGLVCRFRRSELRWAHHLTLTDAGSRSRLHRARAPACFHPRESGQPSPSPTLSICSETDILRNDSPG